MRLTMASSKELTEMIDQIMNNAEDYSLKGSEIKFLRLLREAQERSGSRKLTVRQRNQIKQILENVMPGSIKTANN
jgi:hypothetical protein